MVCEFLSKKYKEKLIEIASVDDLVASGFTRRSAKNIKHQKIISDERCDRLVTVLGSRALPVLREALQEFVSQVQAIERELGIQTSVATGVDLDRVYDQVKDRLGLTTIEIVRQQMGLSLEQFLAKYRDYILQHYELYAGGKEGIVLNGVIHGVIRRKS